MLKTIIGILKWKSRMKKLAKKTSFTKEWWSEAADALEFLPKEERQGFLDGYISTMLQF